METTIASYLLDLARENSNRRLVVVKAGPDPDTAIAVIKLALVLQEHRATAFRAMVEGWDQQRIVRELY